MGRERVVVLLRYAGLLVAIVGGILGLSLLVGDRGGVGRVVWLVVGVFLGSLLALRSRLSAVGAPDPAIAVVSWAGLLLAGVVALAVAPTSLPVGPTGPSAGGALKPAPPTAVLRTGTVVTTPRPTVGRPAAASPATPGGSPLGASSPVAQVTGVPAVPGMSQATATARAASAAGQTPVLPPDFDPQRYLGQGNAYDCDDLGSQAEAQAILRADPTDPNVIDRNRDGVACEDLPPPLDTRRVPRP